MRFCIALLSQRSIRKKYNSPLVCALAVLGVKEDEWKGVELYPLILSAVIKVARFVVVQQALELLAAFKDVDFDGHLAHSGRLTRLLPSRPMLRSQHTVA